MALGWCATLSSSRPPDTSSFSPATGARTRLASNKDSFLYIDLYSCSSHHCCPGHLVPVGTRWKKLQGGQWSGCVVLLGIPGWKFPRNAMSGKGTKSCCDMFREKGKFLVKMQEVDLRGFYYNLPPCA